MQLTTIQKKIFEIREQKVMLDFDLAELYGVETKRLKEAVRRNMNRFPPEFMFELAKHEWYFLRSQTASLKKGSGKQPKYLPFAFTEYGIAMLSSILNSEKAIQVNITIIKTFIAIKEFAVNYKTLETRIADLEKKFEGKINDIHEIIDYLLNHSPPEKQEKSRIGFRK